MASFGLYGPPSRLLGELARALGLPVGRTVASSFKDGERRVLLSDLEPGRGVLLVLSTGMPVDSNVMTLAFMADAARRAGNNPVVGVVPYFGYARGDRLTEAGTAIPAAVVARTLEAAGLTHLVTLDLHNPAIAGFFGIPVIEGSAIPAFATRLGASGADERVVVAPDAGGIPRATRLASLLGLPLAISLKRRPAPDAPKALGLWGDVAGREAILVDDMVVTGGTIAGVSRLLRENGATAIDLVATHAVITGDAQDVLRAGGFRSVILTDTLAFEPREAWPGLEILSVAPILADLIRPLLIE